MLFKDKKLQAELEQNGFVVIPFLNDVELRELNQFYGAAHHHADPPGFIDNIHMTTWCKESNYKQHISKGLTALFKHASDLFFENCRRLNHVFIVKKSGQQSTFKVHQDWNVVDENKYQSVNVWVPLHHVDESSGALWILKGSHRINRKVRGAGYLFPEYGPYFEKLEKAAVSVTLKAGEAIVFYHSVIHGSPSNLSGQNRVAACFSVIPETAPLCIYFQKQASDPLEQHEPKDDFIYQYDHLRTEAALNPPTQKPVALHAPFINKKVDEKEIDLFIKPKLNLLSKLFGR